MPLLPDAHFGKVTDAPIDWRKRDDASEAVDDDEQLAQTPDDVVEMLGFDPLDDEEDDEDVDEDDTDEDEDFDDEDES